MKTKLLTIALAVAAIVGGVATTVSADTIDVSPGESIQDAINSAAPGDIINIAAGTYAGPINVTKAVTLRGAQAGNDARSRTGLETIITAEYAGGFSVKSPNVVIDGFTIDGINASVYGRGVVLDGPDVTNLTIRNNIIKDNQTGVTTSAPHGKTVTGLKIDQNLFTDNSYPSAAAGIFVVESAGSGIEVTNNTFLGTDDQGPGSSNAISLSGTASVPMSGITISGNESSKDGSFIYIYQSTQVNITNNTSDAQAGNGVLIGNSTTDTVVADNTFTNSNNGVRFGGNQPSSNVTISGNTISGMATAGVMVSDGAVSGDIILTNNTITDNAAGVLNESSVAVDANNNWWGCEAGPGAAGCDTIDGVVLASSWYTDAALTATNLDEDETETVPGVPNTSWVNERSGLIVAAIAGLVAVVLGSVAVMRRRSARP